jgi:ubiquinone/menaquinone biosynthesis C-methylase UbiE
MSQHLAPHEQSVVYISKFRSKGLGNVENLEVRDYWDASPCGETAYAKGTTELERFESQKLSRYKLEPFISSFAKFPEGLHQKVLEIGVGMGADHEQWARSNPRLLCGIDLSQRAIDLTRERLTIAGLQSDLRTADAEHLPFKDEAFFIVYSWGVLHHSNETADAFAEVSRVLKKGGFARVMIYHKHSILGFMLWLRYGFPLKSLASVYAKHLESPGTKAFTVNQARKMLAATGLVPVSIEVQLSPGDLLSPAVGQQHRGGLLRFAKAIWPRFLIKAFGRRFGLYMMIEAIKS